jgi:hypothetical protein
MTPTCDEDEKAEQKMEENAELFARSTPDEIAYHFAILKKYKSTPAALDWLEVVQLVRENERWLDDVRLGDLTGVPYTSSRIARNRDQWARAIARREQGVRK